MVTRPVWWKNGFSIAGIFLLVVLVGWISYSIAWESRNIQQIEPGGPQIKNAGPEMPVADFEATVKSAKHAMNTQYESANRMRWYSHAVDWLGFAFTSIITILVGMSGRVLSSGQDPSALLKAESVGNEVHTTKWILRTVGILAALASVLTGVSSRLQATSQTAQERGDKMHAFIVASRQKFREAVISGVVEEARKVIDDLGADINRNQ